MCLLRLVYCVNFTLSFSILQSMIPGMPTYWYFDVEGQSWLWMTSLWTVGLWLESHALNMSVKWLVTFIQEGSLYRLKWKYHHHHIFSALENLSSFSTKYSLSCSTDKFRNLWQLFLSTSSIKPRCIILMADFVLFTICFAFVQRLY